MSKKKQKKTKNIHMSRDHTGMGSANERRHYIVTSPLIGWAHT